MEMKREEGDERRMSTSAIYNPCYLLEEALNALLKCLGFETPTTAAQNKKNNVHHLKPHSDADLDGDDIISSSSNPQICECDDTNMKGSYQEDEEDPPPSSTSQDAIITTDANLASRRQPAGGGGGRPGLSGGPGPQHN